MTFGAYTLVNIWQNNQWCGRAAGPKCYEVRDPLDLAVVAGRDHRRRASASCGGTPRPAKIFMGDTGSLALGGALAGFAVLTRTEFLLAVLGGLFVLQTLSVILQVGYFKATGGKRMFRMAPLHHHFELKGWDEITVVIRFWIINGICVARRARDLLRGLGGRHVSGAPRRPDVQILGRTDSWAGGSRRGRRHRRVRLRGRGQPDPLGAQVTVLAESATAEQQEKATLLEILGGDVRIGVGRTAVLPDDVDLLVTRPAGRPTAPCWPGGAARRSRSGARSSWPGGCATPATRALAGGDRHQRQDHDRADARAMLRPAACAASPAATSGCRSSRR
jgi:hypothetical protein